MTPTLIGLDASGSDDAWRAAGFAVVDGGVDIGAVRFRIGCAGRGITAWSLAGVRDTASVDGLVTRVDATACAKAAESPSSVRQYVWRTRMIYGLQMSDYVRFVGDEPKAGSARAAQATPRDSVAGVARPLP